MVGFIATRKQPTALSSYYVRVYENQAGLQMVSQLGDFVGNATEQFKTNHSNKLPKVIIVYRGI